MQRNTIPYNSYYCLHIINDQRIVKICGHAAWKVLFYNPSSNNMCNLVSFEKRDFPPGVSNLQLGIRRYDFYVLISSFKNCKAAIHDNAHVCDFKYTGKLILANVVFYINTIFIIFIFMWC